MQRRLSVCVVILILGIFCYLDQRFHFFKQHAYTAAQLNIQESYVSADMDQDGLIDAFDLVDGARLYMAERPRYKSRYYSNGYPDDGYGVCVDVIIQAMLAAGYDIKAMIDEDIRNNPEVYPWINKPDPNIDFRRVKNLNVFFIRWAEVLDNELIPEKWMAGDIVVFDGHIALCSDKRNAAGIPFIIHHDPWGIREANEIDNYEIIGHYRFTKSVKIG